MDKMEKGKEINDFLNSLFEKQKEQHEQYENLVKVSYSQIKPTRMLENAIGADITAYFLIPQNINKKTKEDMVLGKKWHIKKPDGDNIAKIILDALNGIVYHDDGQICKLSVKKLYSVFPRVGVSLYEL